MILGFVSSDDIAMAPELGQDILFKNYIEAIS
ncbi:MAG: hypothetical protein JWR34_1863 [Mycobacterium sp.]|jgi:hypothetical protein|nr:hypothetical protein [Mycobacterium sp.]